MRRLIAWWMSAPWGEREALFFVLGIWTFGAIASCAASIHSSH